jgi:uncharacterized membrane protein
MFLLCCMSMAKKKRMTRVQVSYAVMASGFITAFLGTPWLSGMTARFGAAAAIIASCVLAAAIDKRIMLRGGPCTAARITRSNFMSAVLLLLPFASRSPTGSWENLILDTAAYCGSVFFLSYSAASRIEPSLRTISRPFSRLAPWLFPLSCLAYFIIVGGQLASSYHAYEVEWVDFSFEFAPVWQTCRNGFFRMINEFSQETLILRYHWPLIYVFLSPLTLLFHKPSAVLWVSTLFFTASAYPVYLLAKHYSHSKQIGSVIGSLYLLYLPVHLANLYDFHADPLALPLLFFSFLFAARKKWLLYCCAVAGALACKEYVGLLYVGYGLWLSSDNRKAGITTAAAGLLWFLFAVAIGIPFFNQGAAPLVINANFGDIGGGGGIAGIVPYALVHPAAVLVKLGRQTNIVALLSMFLPFLFLPFRKPWLLAAGGLILLKNALSESGIELLCHRETLFFPVVVYAFILCISSMSASARRFRLCAVAIAVVVTFVLQGHAIPARGFWLTKSHYSKSDHDRVCDSVLQKIPPQAVVMSSSHLAPHLMARRWYFLFPRFPTPVEPDYIVVDTLEQADWGWLTRKEHQGGFWHIKNTKDYETIEEKDGVFLFKRAER